MKCLAQPQTRKRSPETITASLGPQVWMFPILGYRLQINVCVFSRYFWHKPDCVLRKLSLDIGEDRDKARSNCHKITAIKSSSAKIHMLVSRNWMSVCLTLTLPEMTTHSFGPQVWMFPIFLSCYTNDHLIQTVLVLQMFTVLSGWLFHQWMRGEGHFNS